MVESKPKVDTIQRWLEKSYWFFLKMGRLAVLYLFCRLLFLNWEVKLVVWKLKWFYGRPSAEEDPNIFLLMRPLPGRYVTLYSFVYCDALERVATYFKMLAAVAVVRMYYYLNVVSISTYSNKENRMVRMKNEATKFGLPLMSMYGGLELQINCKCT